MKHAPHRTALYRTRKRLFEDYMRRLNRKILERLKPAKKVGVDATGLRQSNRDGAWSSAGESGRREYVKLHALFNLEARTVETFEVTAGTEHEYKHLEELLADLDDIECLVADAGYLSRKNCRLARANPITHLNPLDTFADFNDFPRRLIFLIKEEKKSHYCAV